MLLLFLAFLGCTLLHLSAIALAARDAGVRIRIFSIGFGPRLLQIGNFRLGAIPTGGYVKFMDSREEPVSPQEMPFAFDGKSTAQQVFITLSGCAALFIAAAAAEGAAAGKAFTTGPLQFVTGALSPFGEAQELLRGMSGFVRSASPLALLGTVAAKMAAINLLPLPAFNGGAAIATMARAAGLHRHWPPVATRVLLWVPVAALASWLVAIGAFFIQP